MSHSARGRERRSAEDPPEEPEATRVEEGDAPTLLDLLLDQTSSPPPLAPRIDGVVVGRVASVDASGALRVTFAGAPAQGFAARTTTPIAQDDAGREVALLFEDGDPRRPIVMGKVVSPVAPGQTEAAADGRRVEINAEEEIVLRCGESSITLTRAGKIVIRGAYVLSRSSGVNRIQGGSVEIN
ncbi:DUF6484 domain-containing protein [Sorangium sp. So ce118]